MTTQTQYPWQATVRTVFQAALALAFLLPVIAPALGAVATSGVFVGVLAACGAFTRVMALPQVNAFLVVYVPWLAPEGKNSGE